MLFVIILVYIARSGSVVVDSLDIVAPIVAVCVCFACFVSYLFIPIPLMGRGS